MNGDDDYEERMMMIKRERSEMIKQTRCCVVSGSHFAANNC